MPAVRLFAWVYYAGAVLIAGMALNYEEPVLFGAALTAVLAGVLLQAVDMALVRLTEIRDALRGQGATAVSSEAAAVETPRTATSLDELERRLQKARGG